MPSKAETGLAVKAPSRKNSKSSARKPSAEKHAQQVALRAIMALYREFEQVSRRSDISMAQYRTLVFLMYGARRAGEISSAAAITKPTVSLLLNSLRTKGWIKNVADDTDGRVSLVLITPKGIKRIEQFEAELAEAIFPCAKGVDLPDFYASLRKLYKSLGESKGSWVDKVESELD